MSDNSEKELKYISPFKYQLLQSFPFIAEDFDQLTAYGLFCRLADKMNEVVANNNNLNDDMLLYIQKFNQLKAFVEDYFENLDVQDEIDNKLDEMAENGTLAEIIEDYATIPELTTKVNKLELGIIQDEIIIVGDSYLAGQSLTNPSTENYGYLLMQKLGMNTNNFHIWAEGGSSFTNPRKPKS